MRTVSKNFIFSPKFTVRMNEMCWIVSLIFLVGELNEKVGPENAFECILNSKYLEHISYICM